MDSPEPASPTTGASDGISKTAASHQAAEDELAVEIEPGTGNAADKQLKPSSSVKKKLRLNVAAKQDKSSGKILAVLRFYISFGYFTGIIPFRLVPDKDSNSMLKLATSTIQTNICRVFHLLTLLYELYIWRYLISSGEFYDLTTGNTTDIFQVILGATEAAYILMYFHILWSSSISFVNISNSYPYRVGSSAFINSKNPSGKLGIYARIIKFLFKYNLAGIILCLISTALAIYKFYGEYKDEKDIFGVNGYLTVETKRFFFMSTEKQLNSGLTHAMSVIYVIAGFTTPRVIFMIDLFFLIIGCLLYEVACNVQNTLEKVAEVTIDEVLELYNKAKAFTDILNQNFGKLTLALVLSFIPYYADKVPKIITLEDHLERTVIIINIVSFTLFLYLTSTFSNKMKCLQDYFANEETALSVPSNQLRVMLEEIESQRVGLSAYGFFIVTYAAIAQLLKLLATYGFIATQFKGNSTSFGNMTGIVPNDFFQKMDGILSGLN